MRDLALDCIVFVLRQSPDWKKLAWDYERGIHIDTIRYKPQAFLEGFPENIEQCIHIWNKTFPVNFFQCRTILKDIAGQLLREVDNAIILSENDIANLSIKLNNNNFLLFFLDDDDWFAPDTFDKISSFSHDGYGISVFPLVRFDSNTFSFIRNTESARTVIGYRQDFHFRFQTNNYGVGSKLAFACDLKQLQDHVSASHYADKMSIVDKYFDVLISATNKTPCSASRLPALVADPCEYKAYVLEYVKNLEGLAIPAEMAWCEPPLKETVDLFRSLLTE